MDRGNELSLTLTPGRCGLKRSFQLLKNPVASQSNWTLLVGSLCEPTVSPIRDRPINNIGVQTLSHMNEMRQMIRYIKTISITLINHISSRTNILITVQNIDLQVPPVTDHDWGGNRYGQLTATDIKPSTNHDDFEVNTYTQSKTQIYNNYRNYMKNTHIAKPKPKPTLCNCPPRNKGKKVQLPKTSLLHIMILTIYAGPNIRITHTTDRSKAKESREQNMSGPSKYKVHKVQMSWSRMDQTNYKGCLLYTSPSPRDRQKSRMPSSA